MKLLISIPMLFLAASFTACTKQSSPANIATPDNTKQVAAPVTQLTVAAYPYTDTFAGSMAVVFDDFGAGYDSTDKNFSFYATHVSENLIIVKGSKPIQLELYSGIININDSVNVRPNNAVDSGDMHLFPYEQNSGQVIKNGIAFQFANSRLTVSWNGIWCPLLGTCDQGQSSGQFNGVLVRRNR